MPPEDNKSAPRATDPTRPARNRMGRPPTVNIKAMTPDQRRAYERERKRRRREQMNMAGTLPDPL